MRLVRPMMMEIVVVAAAAALMLALQIGLGAHQTIFFFFCFFALLLLLLLPLPASAAFLLPQLSDPTQRFKEEDGGEAEEEIYEKAQWNERSSLSRPQTTTTTTTNEQTSGRSQKARAPLSLYLPSYRANITTPQLTWLIMRSAPVFSSSLNSISGFLFWTSSLNRRSLRLMAPSGRPLAPSVFSLTFGMYCRCTKGGYLRRMSRRPPARPGPQASTTAQQQ